MSQPPAPPPLPPEVVQALQAGQTIEAIRRLRASSGLGLREAKALIDAAQAEQDRQHRQNPSTGRPTQRHGPVEEPLWRSRPSWIVALAVILALVGWWLAQRS